ncbi:MAG: hypothetical protein N2689_18400, partial [Verrucomicrobiae bacterium]|nr:hypothetical protein [Verrucomicrobiae bacterium]
DVYKRQTWITTAAETARRWEGLRVEPARDISVHPQARWPALAAAGVPVVEIKRAQPRVEEAFISLIAGRQRKAE